MPDEVVTQTAAPAAESVAPTQSAESKTSDPPKPPEKNPAEQKQSEVQKVVDRRLKLTIDGVEEEMDEQEVVKLAQLSKASSKRFQEASKYRKQAEQFIEMLKTDPKSVLEHPDIGVDIKKFAEDYLLKVIEQEQETPEARKLREAEEKLAQYEEEKKTRTESETKAQFEKAKEQYVQEYEQKIQKALVDAKLPRTEFTVRRMAEYMSLALDNKLELEPSEVAVLVQKDYMSDIMSLLKESEGDKLLEFLGDGIANKLRKADLKRWETQQTAKLKTPEEPKQEDVKSEAEPTYRNIHEWREMMDKKYRS